MHPSTERAFVRVLWQVVIMYLFRDQFEVNKLFGMGRSTDLVYFLYFVCAGNRLRI